MAQGKRIATGYKNWDADKIKIWVLENALDMVKDIEIGIPCDDAVLIKSEFIVTEKAYTKLLEILLEWAKNAESANRE